MNKIESIVIKSLLISQVILFVLAIFQVIDVSIWLLLLPTLIVAAPYLAALCVVLCISAVTFIIEAVEDIINLIRRK